MHPQPLHRDFLCLSAITLLLISHLRQVQSDHIGRMINGADSGFVPHAARVFGFSLPYSTEGSGTFVTQRHVLTAASIIRDMSIFYVNFGNESMTAASTLSGLGFMHPAYEPDTFQNDLGIVRLGNVAGREM